VIKVGVILGSTRPGRNGEAVANWTHDIAAKRGDAAFELVDLSDYGLPLLDEMMPPVMGQYLQQHTKAWAKKIASLDAFIFVTPEYNHGTGAALKNAIDFLYREWTNKAAGIVGYGSSGGTRAAENLRTVLSSLQVATVAAQVSLSIHTDFENYRIFKPAPVHEETLGQLLDQLVAWGTALQPLRGGA
jgi:NAD(P)H-dependent FMN reductase